MAEHRDRYAIWIVTPGDYAHQHAYDDLALGLSEAFMDLGGSAPVVRDPTQAGQRTLIVLGPQLLPPSALRLLPTASVLFNLEQVQDDSPWMKSSYLALLRERPVLDYSIRNRAALAERGIPHARVLPIGYAAGLTRIAPAPEKDIDVLFYGSLNDRRRHVLDALSGHGMKVQHLFGAYGADRDHAIARAKIVLNMHFYDAAIFEAVRVSYLLANSACVVSEGDLEDPDIAPFARGLVVAPYHALVERCVGLVGDAAGRASIARDGFRAIRQRRQADVLRALFAD